METATGLSCTTKTLGNITNIKTKETEQLLTLGELFSLFFHILFVSIQSDERIILMLSHYLRRTKNNAMAPITGAMARVINAD